MSIRTEGDAIFAANAAKDLNALAMAWALNWREHANGCNQVAIPQDYFHIYVTGVALGSPEQPKLEVSVIWVASSFSQIPIYYSPEDDNFSESWGSSNISGYRSHINKSTRTAHYRVPIAMLLAPAELQIERMKSIKAATVAREAECRRQEKLRELQKEIDQLNAQASKG